MFGGHSKVIEPFMAAIEMVHTYSLVHDDLPAMDNDEYRRGRKTMHVVYGEDMAILAGDALLNYAFETAVKAFVLEPEDSLTIGNAIRVLGEKAGIYGMLGGQVIDVKRPVMLFQRCVRYDLRIEDRSTYRSCYDDWSNSWWSKQGRGKDGRAYCKSCWTGIPGAR